MAELGFHRMTFRTPCGGVPKANCAVNPVILVAVLGILTSMTTPPQRPDNDGNGDDPQDQLAEMMRQMFGGNAPDPEKVRRAMEQLGGANGAMPFDPSQMNPAMMQQAMQQFQSMMNQSPSDGPVNWTLAQQTARQAASGKDPAVGSFASREVDDALRLAELWLDQTCELEQTGYPSVAWSRAEWVETTLEQWRYMTEPVAVSLSEAMSRAMKEQLPQQMPEEMQGMFGDLQPMLENMGGTMFGLQLGTAIGELAQEVLSGTDTGFPVAGHRLALLPVNIEEFGDGLQVPDDQIRIYLALREAARMRLFANSPWLERDLFAAVQQYATGLTIDMSSIEEAVQSVDPMDPESMQQVFSGGMFIPEPTGTQKAALEQLETTLALIEGWVDVVVTQAAEPLESATALRETINRRRATGGPAEHAFGSLVGLDLRPRRLREAAQLFEVLEESQGRAYRDGVWQSPDQMPTAEDLDDPQGYIARRQEREKESAGLDDELKKLLDGDFDE